MFLRIRAERGPKPAAARRIAYAAAVAAVALTACSTDNPLDLRPDVDLGTQTSSLAPEPAGMDAVETYGSQPEQTYVDQSSTEGSYGMAAEPEPDAGGGDPSMVWQTGAQPAGREHASSEVDPELGGGDVAASPGTVDPYAVNPDLAQSGGGAIDPYAVNPALAGNGRPVRTAALTRSLNPANGPYGAASDEDNYGQQPNVMPADEIDCRNELKRLRVVYQDLDPIRGGGSCGIEHPVKIHSIGSVKMQPAATLRCEMAAAFAAWTVNELVPAAKRRYLSGVKTIHQASSYSCRNVRRSGTMSEHGKGNALDIGRIELNSGRDIDVEKPGLFAWRTKGFLNSVRSDGCDYFTTVLGPGYDWDHRNHFHFDLRQRRGGYRACK